MRCRNSHAIFAAKKVQFLHGDFVRRRSDCRSDETDMRLLNKVKGNESEEEPGVLKTRKFTAGNLRLGVILEPTWAYKNGFTHNRESSLYPFSR